MHLFGNYNITRNSSGRFEFWKTGEDWVITHFFANDINTEEHIRIGGWVCSVKRIMPFVFKVTYHYPMMETPLEDFDF